MLFQDAQETTGWPEEMSIRVSDGSHLLDLLWLRHRAIGNAEPSLPPAELAGEPSASADPVLVGTWERTWKQSLDHLRRVQEADPRSMSERSDLWAVPPSTATLIDAFDLDVSQGVSLWRESLSSAPGAEMAVVDSVRRAWEAGLRVVIELPLDGSYFRRLSDATLVVSAVTRRDSAEYSKTLNTFVSN